MIIMSMIICTDCGGFCDTDDGEGSFEVKGKEYVCQACLEDPESDYLDEDTGELKAHLAA